MNATEWMVAIGGVIAIAWVNWYFFGARRASTRPVAASGHPEVPIGERGGDDGNDPSKV